MFILIIVAIFTRENFAFTILYLFAGIFLISRWWTDRAIKAITFQRKFTAYAFPGEEINLHFEISNKGLLPVVWLQIQDQATWEIAKASRFFQRVIQLGPRQKISFDYSLQTKKRGYYPIGPVRASTGDLLGLVEEKYIEGPIDFLTVYPRVIPLTRVGLPSRSPMGSLRTPQPIFEDPSRPTGKRDYTRGDSLRRIDWKASASVGRLQVKLFEPSIALETTIFLNLNAQEYFSRFRFDSTELAIVVAASIANWVINQKQSVGLITNGMDPHSPNGRSQPIPPRKGRSQLMTILAILARIQSEDTESLASWIHNHRPHLSWGTTLIVVTGQADDALFNEFYQAQRAGLDLVLILCGEGTSAQDTRSRARILGIPTYLIRYEEDLRMWQK